MMMIAVRAIISFLIWHYLAPGKNTREEEENKEQGEE